MKIMRHLFALLLALLVMTAPADAATFRGEFWSGNGQVKSLAEANAIIASRPTTATFRSSALDYPAGAATTVNANNTTLSTFLGADASSLVGAGNSYVRRSVFRITGFIDILAGNHLFSVGSDDGFRLTIGGVVVSQFNAQRGFSFSNVTANVGSGRLLMELIYFSNNGRTGVTFNIDGTVATPAVSTPISTVPVPAPLTLILAALLGLALVARWPNWRAA